MSKKMIVLVGWLLVLFLVFSGCSPQKEGQNAEANNNESTAQQQLDIYDKIKDIMTSLENHNHPFIFVLWCLPELIIPLRQ